MEAITNLLLQNEALQNKISELQKQLRAKIHDVPIEKIVTYVAIGSTVGIVGYWVYQRNQDRKNSE